MQTIKKWKNINTVHLLYIYFKNIQHVMVAVSGTRYCLYSGMTFLWFTFKVAASHNGLFGPVVARTSRFISRTKYLSSELCK